MPVLSRFALLGLIGLAGCSAMNNQAATAEYARQVTVASTRMAQLEEALSQSDQRLEQLEEVIRQKGRDEAEALENLDQVVAEIKRLRGEIETMQFTVDEMKQGQEAFLLQNEARQLHDEARLKQIEKFLGVTPPPPPVLDPESGAVTADGEATDGSTTGDGSTDAATDAQGDGGSDAEAAVPEDAPGKLDLALKHMEEGRQSVARVILQKAIEEHPGAPEMAELRYRFAETLFNENDWRKSVGAFEQVIQNHPKSEWAPWAMVRQGESFKEMGQGDNAKLFYEEVTRRWPKSDAAQEAQKLLAGG